MTNHRTSAVASRVLLSVVCLVIAPVVGVWAGASMPNPPGNGPGIGQVVVGVAIPVAFAFVASRVTRVRRLEATMWAVASLATTGVFVVFVVWFVATYLPT